MRLSDSAFILGLGTENSAGTEHDRLRGGRPATKENGLREGGRERERTAVRPRLRVGRLVSLRAPSGVFGRSQRLKASTLVTVTPDSALMVRVLLPAATLAKSVVWTEPVPEFTAALVLLPLKVVVISLELAVEL